MKPRFTLLLFLLLALQGHAQAFEKHCISCEEKNCKCPRNVALSDSLQLKHIKNQFYKNASGHIYDKTFSATPHREITYFKGSVPQDVDPLTFEVLQDSWYARDKNHIYYYRGMSSGMNMFIMEEADYNSFRPLEEGSWNAMDKNHFYAMGSVVEGFDPKTTTIIRDKDGFVEKLISGKKEYKF